ncbi:tetratricopeptide repeat protein [Kutzneria sp. NPDC052558]|uniref:tetratricopeptide repeat protein n=1 Tax=Kutzneria sp. NPDC052558 TaxID=3364121 RepID=UPI0037CB6CCD
MSADTVTEFEKTVEKCRARAAEDPAHRPELAAALTALGVAYHDHARYPDAVALIEEAVDTWRLVDGHRPDLAAALTTLSSYYTLIGLDEEAAVAAREAADL